MGLRLRTRSLLVLRLATSYTDCILALKASTTTFSYQPLSTCDQDDQLESMGFYSKKSSPAQPSQPQDKPEGPRHIEGVSAREFNDANRDVLNREALMAAEADEKSELSLPLCRSPSFVVG